jgi:type II secretory ATPase GspE/PulE/Tfp pilus assembly ATPase PilB-like protein
VPKTLFRGEGCLACGHTGYKGRIGIFEILDMNEETREYIVDPKFTLDGLRAIGEKHGFISMFEDGLRKVERGMTTIEEILRVIRE